MLSAKTTHQQRLEYTRSRILLDVSTFYNHKYMDFTFTFFPHLPSTTITRKPLVRLKVEEGLWLQFHLFSLIFSHVSAPFPPNTEALIIISLESFGFSPSHRIWAAKSPLILFNIHNAREQYLENQNPAYLLWCLQHQHFLQTNVLNFKPHLTRQTSKGRIYLSEF